MTSPSPSSTSINVKPSPPGASSSRRAHILNWARERLRQHQEAERARLAGDALLGGEGRLEDLPPGSVFEVEVAVGLELGEEAAKAGDVPEEVVVEEASAVAQGVRRRGRTARALRGGTRLCLGRLCVMEQLVDERGVHGLHGPHRSHLVGPEPLAHVGGVLSDVLPVVGRGVIGMRRRPAPGVQAPQRVEGRVRAEGDLGLLGGCLRGPTVPSRHGERRARRPRAPRRPGATRAHPATAGASNANHVVFHPTGNFMLVRGARPRPSVFDSKMGWGREPSPRGDVLGA